MVRSVSKRLEAAGFSVPAIRLTVNLQYVRYVPIITILVRPPDTADDEDLSSRVMAAVDAV
jgi:hypothetical protein